MTLVVSQISRHGVTMVGDSAVTFESPIGLQVTGGAAKIQYSESHNVGFAMWGNGTVCGRQIDLWMKDYIENLVDRPRDFNAVAVELEGALKNDLSKDQRTWKDLRLGIHVAGYKNGLPRLWHIHGGHVGEPPREPRLHRDYPEDQGWTEEYYHVAMTSEGGTFSCQLRNGYTPHYGLLYKHMLNYVNSLRGSLGIKLPRENLASYLEFNKILVRFVAGALVAAGEHPGVNDELSSVSFNEDGLATDERLPVSNWLPPDSGGVTQHCVL